MFDLCINNQDENRLIRHLISSIVRVRLVMKRADVGERREFTWLFVAQVVETLRHSPATVLYRTTHTRTITQDGLLTFLGLNHLVHIYGLNSIPVLIQVSCFFLFFDFAAVAGIPFLYPQISVFRRHIAEHQMVARTSI